MPLSLLTIAAALAFVLVGRFRPEPVRRTLAGLCLLIWLGATVFWVLPANFDPAETLPLHICDLVGLAAPLALGLGSPPARALLYFWGLGLTTQAFITPDVAPDPARLAVFWLTHGAVLAAALFDLLILRYRPTAGHLGLTWLVTIGYAAVVFPIDTLTGWNYGYLGPTDLEVRTLLDLLGPWPQRVLWIVLIVSVLFVLMWLPWRVAKAVNTHEQTSAPT